MSDAKARLERIISTAGPDASPSEIADALLAAGVTLPPQPAGPVTSEEAVVAYEVAYNARRGGFLWFDPIWRIDGRHCFDAAMPLLARDHGLLTPAEVERALSSFDWSYDNHPNPDEIMAALTRGAK